jgi:rhamnogalacturonan hydrolase
MFMIKSNGGSGSVNNCQFNNFIGHSNAYSLDINGYWSDESPAAGNGVLFENLSFNNWKGTCANGATRGPINVICPSGAPCIDITISNFAMWTESGSDEYYKCENAWGSGGCLKSGGSSSYAVVTQTVTSAPSGYSAPTMPSDLKSGFALTASIPIPAIPTTFYPGATPASKLLGS